jgi:hypothetical protein
VAQYAGSVIDFGISTLPEGLQIDQDLVGEAVHVADLVGLADDAIRVDEVGDAQRKVGALIVGRSGYLVELTDFSVDIGEQPVVERFGFGEGLVLLRGVERRAQDDAVGGGKISGPVTQALALSGSTAS